jgi:methyltransferase family protein/glycosyl transferase family 2
MDLRAYINGISFRAIEPQFPLGPDRRLRISRPESGEARLLELPGAPLDVLNVSLPEGERQTKSTLAATRDIPRMSTFAVGAVLNRAVAAMPRDQVYVNVGVWQGYTFFSGALGNPDKRCIGVDNFSEWGKEDVRVALEARLDRIGMPSQTMHAMDYREYFRMVHNEPIGVYLYDGDHAYEHQLQGLEIAEPFLADGCVVVVDDTNWRHPYEATLDFMAKSDRRWEILLDCDTSSPGHPTWWNGLLVIQDVGRASPDRTPPSGAAASRKRNMPKLPKFVSESLASDPALVSLVLHNDGCGPDRLRASIDRALRLTWPRVELIVADDHPCDECQAILDSYADKIEVESAGDGGAVEAAVAASRGEFIAFADSDADLRPSAIQIGLTHPRASRFNTELTPERLAEIETSLSAATA